MRKWSQEILIFSNIFNKKKNNIKKVLSFDGGGVRAIAGVVFLQKLEAEIGKKVSDIFDLFIGTSAGAFNASCLASKNISISELKKYWSKANPSPPKYNPRNSKIAITRER